MKETQMNRRTELWSAFDGRRIVLAGLNNDQRSLYEGNLFHVSRQKHIKLTVTEKMEKISTKDLVLVFAHVSGPERMEESNDTPTEKEELKTLLEALKMLAEKKPAAAVLISDCHVYGKLFGGSGKEKEPGTGCTDSDAACAEKRSDGAEHKRSVKETELGHISHTGKKEISLQYMRMAEHLACRLAQEEQLHIRVARQNLRPETENLEQMLESLLQVLLYGADGEIYNLPASGKEFVFEGGEEKSPLSPVEIVPHTEKIEGLISG